MASMDRMVSVGRACDSRGTLRFVETPQHLPFVVRRVFWITDVPNGAERGGHSHATCTEALFVLRGSFTLDIIINERTRETYNMQAGDNGVMIKAGEWCVLRNFSDDALLLVLADEEYRPEGYTNDYDEFLRNRC